MKTWLPILLVSAISGCGGVSATTSDSIVNVAMQAVELGGREVVRAIDERTARDAARSSDGPAPRAREGERLFVCWLDRDGGEEVFAADAAAARARCRELHGRRREARHCRCEQP